jgi:hypothetical protein
MFSSYPHTRNTNIGITHIRQSKLYVQPLSKQLPCIITLDRLQGFYVVYFIIKYKHLIY